MIDTYAIYFMRSSSILVDAVEKEDQQRHSAGRAGARLMQRQTPNEGSAKISRQSGKSNHCEAVGIGGILIMLSEAVLSMTAKTQQRARRKEENSAG